MEIKRVTGVLLLMTREAADGCWLQRNASLLFPVLIPRRQEVTVIATLALSHPSPSFSASCVLH